MKKVLLNIILIGCSLATFAGGTDYYNVVKIDALSLISSEPRLFRMYVEKGIGKKYSLSFSGEFGKYFGQKQELSQADQIEYGVKRMMFYSITGLGAMTEFRYYPFRTYVDAPLGTFAGAHLRARSVKESFDPNYQNITTFGFVFDVGAHVGYKLNSDQFTLEILLGLGVPYAQFVEPNRRDEIPRMFTEDIDGIASFLRMEMSVGYVFPQLRMKKKKRDYVIG